MVAPKRRAPVVPIVARTMLIGVTLSVVALAQGPTPSLQQFAAERPSEPLIPTLAECDRFSAEYGAFLAKLNEGVQVCLKGPPSPVAVAVGQCCVDYYGGDGPCRAKPACVRVWNEWYCAANDQKAAVARCKEKAAFYKKALDLVRGGEDEQLSKARQTQAGVNDGVRQVGDQALGDSVAGKVFDKAMAGIGAANDAALKEAEKLPDGARRSSAPSTTRSTGGSTVSTDYPFIGTWACTFRWTENAQWSPSPLIFRSDGSIEGGRQPRNPKTDVRMSATSIRFTEDGGGRHGNAWNLSVSADSLRGVVVLTYESPAGAAYDEKIPVSVTCNRR